MECDKELASGEFLASASPFDLEKLISNELESQHDKTKMLERLTSQSQSQLALSTRASASRTAVALRASASQQAVAPRASASRPTMAIGEPVDTACPFFSSGEKQVGTDPKCGLCGGGLSKHAPHDVYDDGIDLFCSACHSGLSGMAFIWHCNNKHSRAFHTFDLCCGCYAVSATSLEEVTQQVEDMDLEVEDMDLEEAGEGQMDEEKDLVEEETGGRRYLSTSDVPLNDLDIPDFD
jgi:hypothetical protein